MNTWRWMMTLGTAGALVAACTTTTPSDDDSSNSDGGAGGTAVTAPASGPGPASGPTTAPASTVATMGSSICGSELSTQSEPLDTCLTASCCTPFDACIADMDCQACLTNSMAPGCDTNTLLDAFNTCADGSCPTTICDTDIGFSSNMGMDPAFACNACATEAGNGCCTSIEACVGDGSQGALDGCIDCLNDDGLATDAGAGNNTPTSTECMAVNDPAIYDAAAGFNQCVTDNCATECG